MSMDYDYDYLGWGTKVSSDDIQKRADYRELEKMDFFKEEKNTVSYEEEGKDKDEYNLWFFQGDGEGTWGEDDETRVQRRDAAKKQVMDFVREVGPGADSWEWMDGKFLDAFLLEESIICEKTEYDSVLLLAPTSGDVCTVAIPWEMVPEDKRYFLLNLQKSGRKIFGAFSTRFVYPEDHFVCVEVYIRND